jgi:hypothetical protein
MIAHRFRVLMLHVLTDEIAWLGVMIALAVLLLLVALLTVVGSTPYRA